MNIQELSKQMNNNTLVNYAPINFYKNFFGVLVKVFLVFFAGWVIFYAISNQTRREFIEKHLLLTCLIFFILITIALLQTWFNSKVYIYQIIRDEESLIIKWQESRLYKEVSIPIKDIKVKLQPSGKNTPYLEVNLQTVILKQTYYPGWNKETMTNLVNKIRELKATK